MDERFADVGRGITLCYEQLGDPGGRPLLLVMGLGTQMIGWPDGFCELLAQRGFRVIRFDNRDIGRSTKLRDKPPPSLAAIVTRSRAAAAYLVRDMADDAAGLLRALDVHAAHVAGASMGGMIAQALAIGHPDKVLSLTSIMSTTGGRFVGQPAPQILPTFLRGPARDPDQAVERTVALFRLVGSPGFERDEHELRAMVRLSLERGAGDTAGTGRQLQAILASKDRSRALRRVVAPTLVIHGTADKLVRPSGGRATARAIPGARLELIDGMGHDLPKALWPRLADLIADNAVRADVRAHAA
ncbi:MAG TPA: alpha/beta fold hydrolase [Baekduia sp.]|nr:alpha/beta fold hydrolase [Baekduia sp.]